MTRCSAHLLSRGDNSVRFREDAPDALTLGAVPPGSSTVSDRFDVPKYPGAQPPA
jgi:hypothetical protein